MAFEFTISQPNQTVVTAIVQFAARRGYRLNNPWWTSAFQLEIPLGSEEEARRREDMAKAGLLGGLWLAIRRAFDATERPRLEFELRRKRGQSLISVKIGSHTESLLLLYELRSYLNDERAFTQVCPPVCPECSAVIRNMTAIFCARCGHAVADEPKVAARRIERRAADSPRTSSEPGEQAASLHTGDDESPLRAAS